MARRDEASPIPPAVQALLADLAAVLARHGLGLDMPIQAAPEWLSVRDAAARLGNVSAKLVYKMIAEKKLEERRIEGCVRVLAGSVDAYLAGAEKKQAQGATAPPGPGVASQPARPTPRPKRRRRSSAPTGFRFLPPQN
jgi:hypothetical protein